MSDLRLCPFCGGAGDAEKLALGALVIMCGDCQSTGPDGETEAESIAAWNTRADTAKDADIARMRDYLERIRDYAPEVTHGWARAIRTFARQGLATDQIETSGYVDCDGGHAA